MNRSLRLIGAVIAGYMVMALIVVVGVMAAANVLVPGGESPGAGYLTANVAVSLVAAVAGGYVAAMVGKVDGKLATLSLAIIVLALGLVFESGGRQPGWYGLAIPIIGAVGVWLGGLGPQLPRGKGA